MFICYRIDYHTWKRLAMPLLIASIIGLLLVFVPGIGREVLGARRWIDLGIAFQPTEIVKLAFLFYLASWLERRQSGFHDARTSLLPFVSVLGLITFLVMAQPDLGTMTVIGMIGIAMYFIGGAPIQHFVWIGASSVALFALLVKIAPYRAARFTVFLNPELDPQGIGYHINQALLAIGSGGLFGVGLGHSRQKFNYLPEASTDSIFAIMAEELGFLVILFFLAAFLAFVFRGFRIAREAPDMFGRLLAAGITSWFAFQAFINIGALTGVLPLTGIPLPFVSYGGTALVVALAASGILLNISTSTTSRARAAR
jgi:cell division protein FtsW